MLWRLAAAYAAALLAPLVLAAPAIAALGIVGRRRWDAGLLPALLLAGALGSLDRAPTRQPLSDGGVAARVQGWIASTPETRMRGERALLEIEALIGSVPDAPRWRSARVRLLWKGGLPRYGRRVEVVGRLRPPRLARNFGTDGELPALAGAGAVAVLEAESCEPIPGLRGPAWRREILEPLRARLRSALVTVLAPREAALLEALVVGARDGVDAATTEAWTALGVNHILSISGMHVALLAAAVLALAGGPHRRRGLCVLLAAVWGYAAVGGLGPTVLRASLMATWGALAIHLGRARAPFVALGVAGVALVWAAPDRRHDLGLQLSCVATAGLLAVAPLAARTAASLAARGRGGRLLAWALAGAAVGIAAQTATLPLQLEHFGTVSWCAPLANLVLVPLTDAALVLALLGCPAALASATLARPLLLVAGGFVYVTCEIARLATAAAELRLFPRVDGASVGAAWVLAVAALAAAGSASCRRRRLALALAVLAVAALAVFAVAGSRDAAPAWRVEALDVGQGDALVLGLGSTTWLIDTGDAHPIDSGARVVLPHLRRNGVRRLRGVVLSHPHRDHCGGAVSVLAALPVDTLYIAAVSAADTAYARLRTTFPKVPVRELARGARLELATGYAATVLWPDTTDVLQNGANGCSLVLWAHGGGHPDLLLPGDLEADGEERLLATSSRAIELLGRAVLVLKAGHHGSDTSSASAFLAAARPDVAIVSVGARNRYGHPGRRTLSDLAASGCRVLRTDRGGAVRLVERGDLLWVERPGARAGTLPALLVDASADAP